MKADLLLPLEVKVIDSDLRSLTREFEKYLEEHKYGRHLRRDEMYAFVVRSSELDGDLVRRIREEAVHCLVCANRLAGFRGLEMPS